jgi:hypothetical protein
LQEKNMNRVSNRSEISEDKSIQVEARNGTESSRLKHDMTTYNKHRKHIEREGLGGKREKRGEKRWISLLLSFFFSINSTFYTITAFFLKMIQT